MHSNGCVHRDLKPSNIFFSLDGVVRLGDFGLAKVLLLDQQRSRERPVERAHGSGVVGTFSYSSPEQLDAGSSDEVGLATDIFSLGLVLAELFCPVATAMERAKLFEELRRPRPDGPYAVPESLQGCPFPALCTVVLAMTRASPQSRPSAKAVTAQLLPQLLADVAAALGEDFVAELRWDGADSGTASPLLAAQFPPLALLEDELFLEPPLSPAFSERRRPTAAVAVQTELIGSGLRACSGPGAGQRDAAVQTEYP